MKFIYLCEIYLFFWYPLAWSKKPQKWTLVPTEGTLGESLLFRLYKLGNKFPFSDSSSSQDPKHQKF